MTKRLLYELGDVASRVARDQAALVTPLEIAAQLSAVLNTLPTEQRAALLTKLSPDTPIEFYPPNVLYSTQALDDIERETKLTTDNVLPFYDGSFDLYETAALVLLALNASSADIDQLSDAARRAVERVKHARAAEPTTTIRTAVRQNVFAGGRLGSSQVPTFVARAIYRLVNPSEQTTLALVSRQFSTLIEQEPLEEYWLRNDVAFPLLQQFWKRSVVFVPFLFLASQRLQVHLIKGLNTCLKVLESSSERRRLALSDKMRLHLTDNDHRKERLTRAEFAVGVLVDRLTQRIVASSGDTTSLEAERANYTRLSEVLRSRTGYNSDAINAMYDSIPSLQARFAEAKNMAAAATDDQMKQAYENNAALAEAELMKIEQLTVDDLKIEIALIRTSLALLTVRPKLGPESTLTASVFGSTFDKRRIDFSQRVFGHIAAHPRVKSALLRPGIASFVNDANSIRLMDAETIMRDGVYRPKNIYAKLDTSTFDLDNDVVMMAFDIARRYGVERDSPPATSRSAAAFSYDISNMTELLQQTSGRPAGAAEPVLVGRYYVYSNDLPSPNPYLVTAGDKGVGDVTEPLIFGIPSDESDGPFRFRPEQSSSVSRMRHRGLGHVWLTLDDDPSDSNRSAAPVSQPVALIDRVINPDGTVSLRVECYLVSTKPVPLTTSEQSAQASSRAELQDLVRKVIIADSTATRVQNDLLELALDAPVPDDILQRQREAAIAVRTASIAFIDAYDRLPTTRLPIVAAVVWQTPPIYTDISRLAGSFQEIVELMNLMAPTRNAFRLTRAITRADVALFIGIEQLLSSTAVIYSKLPADNPPFHAYLTRLTQTTTFEHNEGLAAFNRADDASSSGLYSQALLATQTDGNNAIAPFVIARLEEQFVNQIGTLVDWTSATLDTRTPAGKYTEVEYLVLKYMFMSAAFLRVCSNQTIAYVDDFSNNEENWPDAFRHALRAIGNRITDLVNATLEPIFTAVTNDASRRAVIEAALSVFHLGDFANPFSEFQPLKRITPPSPPSDSDDDVDDKPKRARTNDDDNDDNAMGED